MLTKNGTDSISFRAITNKSRSGVGIDIVNLITGPPGLRHSLKHRPLCTITILARPKLSDIATAGLAER